MKRYSKEIVHVMLKHNAETFAPTIMTGNVLYESEQYHRYELGRQ